jgi:TRAP-type C4-dicarboxylate transport system substrate-binding protein
MGPKHPMNKAVFTPFADRLKQMSGGKLTVKQYAGGTLNSAPPKQHSILLEGVADIAFGLPGYTGQLFPVTNTISVPGTADDALDGTIKLWNAISLIEKEYDAKIIALWANDTKVLITKKAPVRTLEDMKGLKVRVTSSQDVPFIEALGASAVSQPVNVIQQNLANGTIDAIMIGASAIGSFKLWEPANYVTVNVPTSSAALFVLMNKEVWEGLSREEKAWVDTSSGRELSILGGEGYVLAGKRGLALAESKGIEIIELSDREVQRFKDAMNTEITGYSALELKGGVTGGEVLKAMMGQ